MKQGMIARGPIWVIDRAFSTVAHRGALKRPRYRPIVAALLRFATAGARAA